MTYLYACPWHAWMLVLWGERRPATIAPQPVETWRNFYESLFVILRGLFTASHVVCWIWRHRQLRNKRSTSQIFWPTRALLHNGSFCYVWGLISPVNGVRFRSGKKCWVSNAKDFHQAQYLKSLILPFNVAKVARKISRHLVPATFSTRDIFYH